MSFQIVVQPKARKAIKKVPREYLGRVSQAIDALATDPYLGKFLHGERAGQLSYRVGPYRIIYTIQKDVLVIIIVDFGPRQGIYH